MGKHLDNQIEDAQAVGGFQASKSAPMTGKDYLSSLDDGREVWLYGKRIKTVTTDIAFCNTARCIANLYDALHAPESAAVLTDTTDTGSGGVTHRFFKAQKNSTDLRKSRDAIAYWSRMSYGWIGRTPDYKASLLSTLNVNAEYYSPYQENARRWYRKAQERVFFFNHVLANPPADRDMGPEETRDIFIHVEKETDGGLIISGAKVVATGSALTNYTFVGHFSTIPLQDEEAMPIFIVPTHAPGVKLLCRPSYAATAQAAGRPFDYPLSSRFDENDAIFIMDKVFVPWEDILVYRDLAKVKGFLSSSGFAPSAFFHAAVRFSVKLDFLVGLMLKCVDVVGSGKFRSVHAQLGELVAWRNVFHSLVESMVEQPTPWLGGVVLPNADFSMTFRALSPIIYPRLKEIIENTLASALIYVPSHALDFEVPELRPYLDRFLRGSNGNTAIDRVKLMKLMWDSMGTEFGGRHELYERNYGGNHENVRMDVLDAALQSGVIASCKSLVDRCLSDYDLKGWTVAHLMDPPASDLLG